MTIKKALKENEMKDNEKKGLKLKLRLSKETIRGLQDFELKEAVGGRYGTGDCSKDTNCITITKAAAYTCYTCPPASS